MLQRATSHSLSRPFAFIAACAAFLCPRLADAQSQVVGWGGNSYGQTQRASVSLLPYSQIAGGYFHTIALRRDGTVTTWGGGVWGQMVIPANLSGVVQVAAGYQHSIAVKNDGTVACWGAGTINNGFSPQYGQSIVPTNLTDVRQAAGGEFHTVALKQDGTVRCWGAGTSNTGSSPQYGQSIVPSGLSGVTQVAAGSLHTIALRSNGTVVCWGAGTSNTGRNPDQGQSIVPTGLVDITQVAGGGFHTVALKRDGGVVVWGSNSNGQRTVPSSLGGVKQVAAGNVHTIALKQDGSVVCFGAGTTYGTFSPIYGQSAVPSGLSGVTQVGAGVMHTVVVKSDGQAQGWGYDSNGQATPPMFLQGVTQLASGAQHALALKSDGVLSAWGDNSNGQCSFGLALTGYTVQQAAAGYDHSLVLVNGGRVMGMGANSYGQCLGTDVSGFANYSTPAGQLVQLLGIELSGITHIAGGRAHSLAVRSTGTVAAWGDNAYKQCTVTVGLSGVTKVAAGGVHSLALRGTGVVAAWGATSSSTFDPNLNYGQATVPSTLSGVTQIAAGRFHSMALKSNGTVVCWGAGTTNTGADPAYGQSIVPNGLSSVSAIAAGLWHSVALRSDGTVVCWGAGTSDLSYDPMRGQCIVPTGLTGVTQIAAGGVNTMAVLNGSLSGCASSTGAGSATLNVSGTRWQDVNAWRWATTGPRVPGAQSAVDLGLYGAVGSECNATAGTFTMRAGNSLLITSAAAATGTDNSIRVTTNANLSGSIWLLGAPGGASELPANLDVPVLSCATVSGNFDLIQTEVPPPKGKFLTVVPESVGGRTVFSMRLLDLPTGGDLASTGTGNYSGTAVAAETIDINRDGFDDLALAITFGGAQNGLLQILLNDGAGNLGGTSLLTSIPPVPTCLAVGDVDADGMRDVVVGVAGSAPAVRVYRNVGGSLAASTVITNLNGSPTAIAVLESSAAHLMPSGNSIGVGTSGGKLKTYSSDGTLTQEQTLAGTPSTVRGGDTKGSGGTDIVTGGTTSATIALLPPAETGFVQVLRRNSSGVYVVTQSFGLTAKPVAMDVADLDGDGLDDIVTANAEPVASATGSALPVLSIFRNVAGAFSGGVPYQPAGASSGLSVSLIDIDNDGDRDIVGVYRKVSTATEAALLRVDTLGAGTPISIGQSTVLDASDPVLAARGDLDGAAGEDVFLVNQPVVTRGLVEGTQQVRPYIATGGAVQGDLDGDGHVTTADIALLLLEFGPCAGACPADLDGDGYVTTGDIAFMLLLFG
jgi:alpha-tubulin suppressor-like RCC1 family protein